MALTIDNVINLTTYSGNKNPKYVKQLSVIHESSDGEMVQYYINPTDNTQGDKNTYAIGVYDENTKSYTYTDYPSTVWSLPGQRITNTRVDRLGVKAFPGMGAFAFYKLAHRKITRIVIPVNQRREGDNAPTLSAVINADGTTTFNITPPEKPEYECYRIVMEYDIYAEEWITYETEFTAPKPKITGQYRCYAVGYGEEGQLYSKESNTLVLDLTGEHSTFVRPYYTTDELNEMLDKIEQLELKVREHKVEKDVPADAQFTDTIYDDTLLKSQIRANLNNISLLMEALFNQNKHWLIDSDGNQLIDSNGYPLYTAEYTSKLDDIVASILELQSRKYLYWGEQEEQEGGD